MSKKKTTEEFIAEARQIHGDRYDYSKVVYEGKDKKVCIICPTHGEFWQSPHCHLAGYGCNQCAIEYRAQQYKHTKEEFIKLAREVHGNKYDYSKVDYKSMDRMVTIICPEHGEFIQKAGQHIHNRRGCPKCTLENRDNHKKTIEKFNEQAKKVHGDKYDYSKANYVDAHTKVLIICPEHGEFWQAPYSHLNGNGCPICANKANGDKKRHTTEKFIERAKETHGEKYSYLRTRYINSVTKVTITCPEHGDFQQLPEDHIAGRGCQRCGKISASNAQKMTMEEFLERAHAIHGDKYDYSKVQFDRVGDKVCIICPAHGEFWQAALNHIGGQGCTQCANEKKSLDNRMSKEEFIEKACAIHGDKYDYSKTVYINAKTPVTITCPIHGDFEQVAGYHLAGNGCQKCGYEFCSSYSRSAGEDELFEYIKSLVGEENVISNDRSVLSGQEIDVLVPQKNIGFEYNGLYWHSEAQKPDKDYHLNKTIESNRNGISLIQIFEDEWKFKNAICKDMVSKLLDVGQVEVGANDCSVVQVDVDQERDFLDENNIFGYTKSKYCYGLEYNGTLVSLISLTGSPTNGKYTILRLCDRIGYSVNGAENVLFEHFVNLFDPSAVSYKLDRRWNFQTKLTELGFAPIKEMSPDYSLILGERRLDKSNFGKKILVEEYGCEENEDAHQFCIYNGIYRIYDCGTMLYEWKK